MKLAANALTTMQAAKAMLGIPETDIDEQRDIVIANLINSISAWIERTTGRNLGKQVYTETLEATGTRELVLSQWPILAVDYVKDKTGGGVIDPKTYDFRESGKTGVIYKDDGWPMRGYRGGLAYDITAPMRSVEVRYTAGYVLPKDETKRSPCTMPADLQGIVWSMMMQEFSIMQSGAVGLSSFSISDVSWSFDKEPQQKWLDTIANYTRL